MSSSVPGNARSRIRISRVTGLVIVMLSQAVVASSAMAHEKWFHDAAPHATDWKAAFRKPNLLGVIVAIAGTAVLAILWRMRGKRDIVPGPAALGATHDGRRRFYSLVPAILGVHLGIPLIVLGIQGQLFSPNNVLPSPWFYWIGVAQIGIGLSLLYGGLTRPAASFLAAVWLSGIGLVGLEPMLENLHYLGFSLFFFLTGRGPFSMDRLLFPALEPSARMARYAMASLRICTGGSLAFVAFTEKLANPELAKAFLQHYPLNFTSWLGIHLTDELFATCAGATELLIGLCLIFGLFPRTILITAWLFINMTLTIFSWVELVGHLPIYGVMSILLVWTPDEEDQRLWNEGVLPREATAEP